MGTDWVNKPLDSHTGECLFPVRGLEYHPSLTLVSKYVEFNNADILLKL